MTVTDAAHLSRIHRTADLARSANSADAVVDHVRHELTDLLGLRACRFEYGTLLGQPPRLTNDGSVMVGRRSWDVDAVGWPDGEIELRASFGHNWAFYVVQFATMILLALSANTSFGGLPVLLKLLARDNYLPHVFMLKADRQVHRHGVLALAVVSAGLLVFSGGDTNTLVPLFAIGVFVGFTIAQIGMVRHWRIEGGPGWQSKALLNGFGGLLTGVSAVVVTGTKFEEGAWLIVIALPLLVVAFESVRRAYTRIGERLGLGRIPEVPHRDRSVVIVPVSSISRLTSEALTAASLGDEVRAVTSATRTPRTGPPCTPWSWPGRSGTRGCRWSG